jgi:oligopeptide transport system permease protein
LPVLTYAIRRVLWVIPVLFVASLITFFVMHIAPGNPWLREGRQLNPEVVEALNARFGLDQPLPVQYVKWLANVVQGDFGASVSTQDRSVNELVGDAMGPTLQLGAMAFVLAVVLGVPLGIVAALNHRGLIDYAARGIAMLGMAAPAFLLATMLQLWLSSPFYATLRPGGVAIYFAAEGWAGPETWVLPTLALAALPMAQIARFTRASMLDVIGAEYIRTARSKGVEEQRIVTVHMLRNALIPVITIAGPILAVLITGSIVVERVFGIPGLGNLYFSSIRQRDYGTMMAMTIVFAGAVVVVNMLIDLLYGVIDPRIRHGAGEAARARA